VRAESCDPDDREQGQGEPCAGGRAQALAQAAGREHEKGERKGSRHLDADAGHERPGAGAKARARPRAQRERSGEREHDQRVVVGAAERELEQHGIQAHERRRPASATAQRPGRAGDQRDRAEARDECQDLERPQRTPDPQRRRGVAGEGEQRPVGRVLEGPADEGEHGVRRGFRGQAGVGVEPVQRAQPRVADVAEDVLGDQRRAEQQHDVSRDDSRCQRHHVHAPRGGEHRNVARAHDQRERLEATPGDADAEALQRAGHPAGPAAAARRHQRRGPGGGAGGDQKRASHDPRQAEQAEREHGSRAPPGSGRAVLRSALSSARAEVTDPRFRNSGGGLHGRIVASAPGSYDARRLDCARRRVLRP
jgi:hypothetical protein